MSFKNPQRITFFLVTMLAIAIVAWLVPEQHAPISVAHASETTTFTPTDDAYARPTDPDDNFGSRDYLRIKDGEYESYVMFDVTNVSGSITSAILRLRVDEGANNDGPDGGTLYQTEINWDESTLTHNTAPNQIGSALGSAGAVTLGEWVEFDVSSVVSSNGSYSFVLLNSTSNSVLYDTKEDGTGSSAELVVTTSDTSSNTETFHVAADAHAKPSKPNDNYGDLAYMRMRDGEYETFVKFDVANLNGPVDSATLRMYVDPLTNDDGRTGGTLYQTDASWDEMTMTYNTAPSIIGSALGTGSVVTVNTWLEFDVTSVVSGNGSYGFGLFNETSDSVYYTTKEGGVAAELVIITVENTPPVAVDDDNDGEGILIYPGNDVVLNVLSNDTDSDGDPLTLIDVSAPENGVAVHEESFISYYPNSDFVGLDSFNYTISDGNGGIAMATVLMNVQAPSSSPTTFTFTVTDDAYVRPGDKADNNYGNADYLRIKDGEYESYLKFSVTDISGAVEQVTLRLHVDGGANNDGPDGGTLFQTETDWDEDTVTYNTAPALIGNSLGNAGAVVLEQWVEFDVTSIVDGNGDYSFALFNSTGNSVLYDSVEDGISAELVVQTGIDPLGGGCEHEVFCGDELEPETDTTETPPEQP